MVKIFTICVFIVLFFQPSFSQENIREEVSVDWWVVPLFAIDQEGDSINDLVAGDLQLLVNNQAVSDFTLYKRSFNVAEKVMQKKLSPRVEKRKMIFFLFDMAFSSLENMEKSKKVAANIIRDASDSSLFSVFTIDPFAGLIYQAGPSSQKGEILKVIESKVTLNTNAKKIKTIYDVAKMAQVSGNKGAKYTASEMGFRLEEISHSLKNTNRKFFRSFEALYFALNSIKDNKFVYLFSEGISFFARKVIRHDEGEYQSFIRQAAGYMGRSGSVLFIINPAGALEHFSNIESGEDSLRYLALESGGKYMEGNQETLSFRIKNLHRAYYEIAFAELKSYRGRVRKISIQCRRKGVKVHTLHSLEKRKSYQDMNEIEREIFAVNVINRNPFFTRGITLMEVIVKKKISRKNREIYRIMLPKNWLQKEVDIYKAWFRESDGDISVKKTSIVPQKTETEIDFEIKDKCQCYFVLFNRQEQSVLVRGIEVPKQELPGFKKIPEIKAMSNKFEYSRELSTLLAGAAGYCQKLKQAGFHYFCQEKVVESLSIFKPSEVSDISFREDRASQTDMLRRTVPKLGLKRRKVTIYRFDYQIIKDKNEIKEQRKLISKKNEKNDSQGVEFRIKNFLAEKAVFSPVTLLARERQPLYEFRFVKYDKLNRLRCAVIEVLPRRKNDARFVYGQVWIDTSDHSVLKIKANPRSVAGYDKLEFIARNLMAKLFLSLEIHFNIVHQGIRFPDSIILSELYKGGPLITRHMGSRGWERLKTEYTYKNYKFFVVDTKVSAE
jgi:hypothetical protein